MTTLPQAILAYPPFSQAAPIPASHPFDGAQICVHFNAEWAGYVIGALFALTADSTWDSADRATVSQVEADAYDIIRQIAAYEACPMPVQFRLNPSDPHYWDYSNDSGATWTRQPDTVVHFTPAFVTDSTSPGGYDITVNGGLSSDPIPLLTANDPNAVIVNPTSSARNEIQTDGFVNAAEIGVAGSLAMVLAGNAAMLYAEWNPDVSGIVAIIKAKRADDYAKPILVTDTA